MIRGQKPRLQEYLILILASVLAAGLYHFRLFYPHLSIYITPDYGLSDILATYALKEHLAGLIRNFQIPQWTSLIGNGFPLSIQGAYGSFYAPNLILSLLFSLPIANNLGMVISYALILIFTYLSARKIGLRPLGSAFSAVTFGFSFFLTLQASHYEILEGIALFTVLFYLLLSYLKSGKKSYLFLWSMVLGEQILIGFPQTVFITLLFNIGFYLLYPSGPIRIRPIMQKIVLIGIFVLLGCAVGAYGLINSYEMFKISNRAYLGNGQTTAFSFSPRYLLTLFFPLISGYPKDGSFPDLTHNDGHIYWENTAYFGIIAMWLAIVAIWSCRTQKKVIILASFAVLSWLLMLGKHSPLYFIFSFWPFSMFRVPSRFILTFVFTLSLLAGFGLQYARKQLNQYFSSAAIYLFVVGIIVVNLYDVLRVSYNYHPQLPVDQLFGQTPITTYLTQYPDKITYTFANEKQWNTVFTHEGWQDPAKYRFLIGGLHGNLNMVWNIPTLNFYPVIASRRFIFLDQKILDGFIPISSQDYFISPAALNMLRQNGVSFVITPFQLTNTDFRIIRTEAYENLTYNLYAIGEPQPLVFFPKTVKYAQTTNDFLRYQTDPDASRSAIVENRDWMTDTVDTDTACYLANGGDRFDDTLWNFQLTCQADQLVVLRSAFYPGWKLTIDGKDENVFPVNINQTGFTAPAGTHRIRFQYRSPLWKIGLTVSLISLLVGWLGWLLSRCKN